MEVTCGMILPLVTVADDSNDAEFLRTCLHGGLQRLQGDRISLTVLKLMEVDIQYDEHVEKNSQFSFLLLPYQF